MGTTSIFSYGGRTVWGLIAGFITAAVLSVMLLTRTAELRYQRDVNRMVYNDNLGVLNEVKAGLGMTSDSLKMLMSESAAEAANKPYLVVSIADHKIWFKQGKEVLFEAGVATGSGKELVSGGSQWRFETPRGRLVVQEKEEDPAWVPPDWHFMEIANKRGLGVVVLHPLGDQPRVDGEHRHQSQSQHEHETRVGSPEIAPASATPIAFAGSVGSATRLRARLSFRSEDFHCASSRPLIGVGLHYSYNGHYTARAASRAHRTRWMGLPPSN
jgi:hypothetical protein